MDDLFSAYVGRISNQGDEMLAALRQSTQQPKSAGAPSHHNAEKKNGQPDPALDEYDAFPTHERGGASTPSVLESSFGEGGSDLSTPRDAFASPQRQGLTIRPSFVPKLSFPNQTSAMQYETQNALRAKGAAPNALKNQRTASSAQPPPGHGRPIPLSFTTSANNEDQNASISFNLSAASEAGAPSRSRLSSALPSAEPSPRARSTQDPSLPQLLQPPSTHQSQRRSRSTGTSRRESVSSHVSAMSSSAQIFAPSVDIKQSVDHSQSSVGLSSDMFAQGSHSSSAYALLDQHQPLQTHQSQSSFFNFPNPISSASTHPGNSFDFSIPAASTPQLFLTNHANSSSFSQPFTVSQPPRGVENSVENGGSVELVAPTTATDELSFEEQFLFLNDKVTAFSADAKSSSVELGGGSRLVTVGGGGGGGSGSRLMTAGERARQLLSNSVVSLSTNLEAGPELQQIVARRMAQDPRSISESRISLLSEEIRKLREENIALHDALVQSETASKEFERKAKNLDEKNDRMRREITESAKLNYGVHAEFGSLVDDKRQLMEKLSLCVEHISSLKMESEQKDCKIQELCDEIESLKGEIEKGKEREQFLKRKVQSLADRLTVSSEQGGEGNSRVVSTLHEKIKFLMEENEKILSSRLRITEERNALHETCQNLLTNHESVKMKLHEMFPDVSFLHADPFEAAKRGKMEHVELSKIFEMKSLLDQQSSDPIIILNSDGDDEPTIISLSGLSELQQKDTGSHRESNPGLSPLVFSVLAMPDVINDKTASVEKQLASNGVQQSPGGPIMKGEIPQLQPRLTEEMVVNSPFSELETRAELSLAEAQVAVDVDLSQEATKLPKAAIGSAFTLVTEKYLASASTFDQHPFDELQNPSPESCQNLSRILFLAEEKNKTLLKIISKFESQNKLLAQKLVSYKLELRNTQDREQYRISELAEKDKILLGESTLKQSKKMSTAPRIEPGLDSTRATIESSRVKMGLEVDLSLSRQKIRNLELSVMELERKTGELCKLVGLLELQKLELAEARDQQDEVISCHMSEISELKLRSEELDERKAELGELKFKTRQMEKEAVAAQAKIDSLLRNLENMEVEKEALVQKREDQDLEISKLRHELEDWKLKEEARFAEMRAQLDKEMADERQQLFLFKTQSERLEKMVQVAQSQNASLSQHNSELTERVSSLTREVCGLTDINGRVQGLNEQNKIEIQALTDKVAFLDEDSQNMRQQARSFEKDVRAMTLRCEALELTNKELRTSIETLEKGMTALEENNDGLKDRVSVLEFENQELVEMRDTLETELRSTKEKYDALRREHRQMGNLQTECKFLERDLDELESQNRMLADQIVRLEHEAADMIQEKRDTERELMNLRTKAAQLEKAKIEIDKLRQLLEKAKQDVQDISDEKSVLADQLSVVVPDRDELIHQKDQLEVDLGAASVRISELDKQILDLMEVKVLTEQNLKAKAQQYEKARGEIDRLTTTLERTKSDMSQLQETRLSLQDQVVHLRGEREELALANESLRSEIEQLMCRYEGTDKELKDAQTKREALEVLQKQHKKLQESLALLEVEHSDVKQRLKELESEHRTLQDSSMKVTEERDILKEEVHRLTSNLLETSERAKRKMNSAVEEAKKRLVQEVNLLKIRAEKAQGLSQEHEAETKRLLSMIDQLEKEKDALEAQVRAFPEEQLQLRSEMEQTKSKSQRYELEIKRLQESLQKESLLRESDCRNLRSKCDDLQQHVLELDSEKANLLEKLSKVEIDRQTALDMQSNASEVAKRWETKYQDSQTKVAQLHDDKKGLLSTISKLQKTEHDYMDLQNDFHRIEKMFHECEAERAAATDKLRKVEDESARLTKSLNELRTRNEELVVSESNKLEEVATARAKLREAEDKLTALSVESSTLRSDKDHLMETVENLWKENMKITEDLQVAQTQIKDQTEEAFVARNRALTNENKDLREKNEVLQNYVDHLLDKLPVGTRPTMPAPSQLKGRVLDKINGEGGMTIGGRERRGTVMPPNSLSSSRNSPTRSEPRAFDLAQSVPSSGFLSGVVSTNPFSR